jgi:hypothetical protein
VTVNYTGSANNENRAAFCQKKVFTTGGNVSVVLERPFAQINLGTTLRSINPDVNGYPLQLQSSTMEITGVATSFSVADMKTRNETTTVSFEANTVPHNFTPSEVLTVNNVNYAYLGMNYILAANDKSTVDVKYTVSTDVGSITRQIPTVPVEKNHRTNLLGNLLTQETAIQIVVDERFAEPDLEAEAIYMAAANGGEFTLTEDLVLKAPVVVPANSNFVLNLNGKSIKNTTQSEEFGKGEAIIAYGNLTINGEGTVEGSTMAVWARGTDGARVTINGGTYKGCAEGFAKGGRSVIYASSGNVIDIYGGRFESLSADKSSYANTTEGVYAALNVADNNGMINVYGGTFVKQNPAAPGTEPSAWNAAHPNGFVAEGYKAVEKDGVWHVVAGQTDVVATSAAELTAALAASKAVALVTDVTINESIVISANTSANLDLNGHVLAYAVDNDGKASAVIVNNGTLSIINNAEAEAKITFKAENPDMSTIPSYATNTITNERTLTIGANVIVENHSEGGASYAVDNKGVFTLNGGTLKGNKCALRIAKYNQDNVKFVMNGGLVTAIKPSWIQLPGSNFADAPTINVEINDGTFLSTAESSADNNILYTYSFGNSHKNTAITINGGKFLGGTVSIGSGTNKQDIPTLNIKGGTFEYDVLQWLADGSSNVLYTANR